MHLISPNLLIKTSAECGIVFLAFLVRGFSGFGAGLVMAPLLVFFIDLKHVVVISILLQTVGGGYLTLGALRNINRQTLQAVILPSCLASLLGVYILNVFNFKLLMLFLGIITVIFAVRMFISPFKQYLGRLERWSFSIKTLIGAASGLLQGLYGAGGPPIVIFLSNEIPTKVSLRATLLIYFFVLDALLVIVYLLVPTVFGFESLIDLNVLTLGALLLVPTFLGAIAGYWLQNRVSEIGFRRGLALILVLTGLLLIQKG